MAETLAITKDRNFIRVKGKLLKVPGFPEGHTLIGHKSISSADEYPLTVTHAESGRVVVKLHSKRLAVKKVQEFMENYTASQLKRKLDKLAKETEHEKWKVKRI